MKTSSFRFGSVALLCGLLAAPAASTQEPAPAQLPSVELPAPLARVLTDYESAWQARDASALAALFADDGFLLSTGRPPVRGRNAIRERYAGCGGPLSLRAMAYAAEGGLGYIIGGFARERGQSR